MSLEPFVSQETDEWATPPSFVRPLADAVGGFDLDPASGAEQSPVARETYTAAEDGLSQAWHGSVWVNPPYSQMEQWTRKAVNESNRESVELIVMLCKGDSSTDWWQSMATHADLLAAIDERLNFGDAENSAPFASHVFVFGELPDEAKETLDNKGLLVSLEPAHAPAEQTELFETGFGRSDGGV